MATGIGSKTKGGWGKETTWSTGVAITELIPYLSEDITEDIAILADEYHRGSPMLANYQPSSRTCTGSLVCEGVYDTIAGDIIGLGGLLRSVFGAATWQLTPTTVEYEPSTDLDESATIAFEKNVSVWELAGGKFASMEITGNAQGKIQFSFNVTGYQLRRTGDVGIVNTSSTFTGLAPTTNPELIAFDHLIVRVADQGAALDSADQINVSSFTLTFENNLIGSEFATPISTGDALYTLEPIRTGKRNVTLSLTIPRYTADTVFTDFKANTAKQADLKFTGASSSYEFNIFLPNVRIEEPVAPVTGPEIVQQTYNLKALDNNAGTINTNMVLASSNVVQNEIAIETKNARTAAP
jgi:hypothetical protein